MQFMQQHVRMKDVQLYLRDLLKEYGALFKYSPAPSPRAKCFSGGRARGVRREGRREGEEEGKGKGRKRRAATVCTMVGKHVSLGNEERGTWEPARRPLSVSDPRLPAARTWACALRRRPRLPWLRKAPAAWAQGRRDHWPALCAPFSRTLRPNPAHLTLTRCSPRPALPAPPCCPAPPRPLRPAALAPAPGAELLKLFAHPHLEDALDVQSKYPWVFGFDPGGWVAGAGQGQTLLERFSLLSFIVGAGHALAALSPMSRAGSVDGAAWHVT